MTSTLTPVTFINGIIELLLENPKVSPVLTPIFWVVPEKDEPKHMGGGIAGKGKILLVLLPNEYSSKLLSKIIYWFKELGFRHTIYGDAQDRYSFVHDSLTNDIQSLRSLITIPSPRDQHEIDAAIGLSSLSLPPPGGGSERSGLQMRPRSDAAHSANKTYLNIIVRVRPSAKNGLGMALRGSSSRGWLRFVGFKGFVTFLDSNLHLIPTHIDEEINQNTTYVCANGKELMEGDILTRVDNWEIDFNKPFNENMNNAKALVNEAVENERCMSLLFYRVIDTGTVTGSMITTNNTSANKSTHVSDAKRKEMSRDWESIRLRKESKELDNNTGQKSTKDGDEDPSIEDELDFGGGGGDIDGFEEEEEAKEEEEEEEEEVNNNSSGGSGRPKRNATKSWKVIDNESQLKKRKRKDSSDNGVFTFHSDDEDDDDDMPIMKRYRKKRRIKVGDSIVNGAGKKKKKKKYKKKKYKKKKYKKKSTPLNSSRPVTIININTFESTEYDAINAAAKAVKSMLGDESITTDAIKRRIYRLLDVGGGICNYNLVDVPYYFHETNTPFDYPRICQKIWYGKKERGRPVTMININTFETIEHDTIRAAAKAVKSMLGENQSGTTASIAIASIEHKITYAVAVGGGICNYNLVDVPYYFHETNAPFDYKQICQKIWYGDGSIIGYAQCSQCTGRAQYPLALWRGLCAVCFRNKYDIQPIQSQMAEKFADLDFTSMFQKIVIHRVQSESLPDFHRVVPESKRLLWLEDDGNGHSDDTHYSNDLSRFSADANVCIKMGYSVGLIRYDHKNYPELDEYHEQVIREVWHELSDDDFDGIRIVFINFDSLNRRYVEAVGKYGTLVKRVVINKSDNHGSMLMIPMFLQQFNSYNNRKDITTGNYTLA